MKDDIILAVLAVATLAFPLELVALGWAAGHRAQAREALALYNEACNASAPTMPRLVGALGLRVDGINVEVHNRWGRTVGEAHWTVNNGVPHLEWCRTE